MVKTLAETSYFAESVKGKGREGKMPLDIVWDIAMIVVGTKYVNNPEECPYSDAPKYLQVVGWIGLVFAIIRYCCCGAASSEDEGSKAAARCCAILNLIFTTTHMIWGSVVVLG